MNPFKYVDLEKYISNVANRSQDLSHPDNPYSYTLGQTVTHMWPSPVGVEPVACTLVLGRNVRLWEGF